MHTSLQYKVAQKQILPFISNEKLYSVVADVLGVAKSAAENSKRDFYKNVIDPFSAIFDAMTTGITLTDWIKKEGTRQVQKTIQNALGTFHQEILGNFTDWKSLGTGNVVDLVNDKKKIIAEVKNKFNTTKGNHKTAIYDDLENLINGKYKGYVGYYVEVIPQGKKEYNKVYTPSDNKTKTRRSANENIRVIDGKSFYKLASNQENALKDLYHALPQVIGDILGISHEKIKSEETFIDLFRRAYN